MRKKFWLVGLLVVGLLVVALGTTTVFAQGSVTTDNRTWGQMQQACQTGDYATMAKLHEQCSGGKGLTSGGMMGGGQNGMMGGGWSGGRGMTPTALILQTWRGCCIVYSRQM